MSVEKSGKFEFVSFLSFSIVSNPLAISQKVVGPLLFYTWPISLTGVIPCDAGDIPKVMFYQCVAMSKHP